MTNGITPALRTTVREICGSEHVVQAMAYIDGKSSHRSRVKPEPSVSNEGKERVSQYHRPESRMDAQCCSRRSKGSHTTASSLASTAFVLIRCSKPRGAQEYQLCLGYKWTNAILRAGSRVLRTCFCPMFFPPVSGSRAVSIVIGSAIGGLLVQPVMHYPNLFSSTGVFGK